jgi:predicted AAA+ superfamily ATPase
MDRTIYAALHKWSQSPQRKPLILQGARQVGKTHALKWLGETHYENTISLNFEKEPLLKSLFDESLAPDVLVPKISSYFGSKITPGKTLVIFDEIQECKLALNSLKYFCEDAPEHHIAAAGSLLGVRVSKGSSFPVGKVDFLEMHPLSFSEFLKANQCAALQEMLEKNQDLQPLSDAFHQKLLNQFRNYLIVGGMPEAVERYVKSQDFQEARKVQEAILKAYENDFSKYAETTSIPKIFLIWNSIPTHLARENKRFIFSALKKGARGRDFESALTWLANAGLIHFCNRITKPAFPLKAYNDPGIFKAYGLDTGLMGAMANLPTEILFRGSRIFQEFNGAFIENFVAQELIVHGFSLHYWESEGRAEVDFIAQTKDALVPVEVKAGVNVKSKSLQSFHQKFPEIIPIYRANLQNFQKNKPIENLPLYAAIQVLGNFANK